MLVIASLAGHALPPPEAAGGFIDLSPSWGPGAAATVSGDGTLFTCDDPGTAHRVLAPAGAMVTRIAQRSNWLPRRCAHPNA